MSYIATIYIKRWLLDSDQYGLRGVSWPYVVLLYYKLVCTIIDWVNFQEMLTLKANRVNLWHICYLGVLRGAELEFAICPAKKWLISPKKWKFQDGRHRRAKISKY